VAFDTPQTFAPGQMLALKLTMFPRLETIMCLARVISGGADEHQRSFSTSVEFVGLDEPQRQLLARHILRTQSAQQRRR
jgi:hypothetical protein